MNPITYMSPYHRTATGPRLKMTGSNCGWVSTAGSFKRTGAALFYGDGPDELDASQVAHVVARAARRHEIMVARHAVHDEDHARGGERRAVHRHHGDEPREARDAGQQERRSGDECEEFHMFLPIWM